MRILFLFLLLLNLGYFGWQWQQQEIVPPTTAGAIPLAPGAKTLVLLKEAGPVPVTGTAGATPREALQLRPPANP